MIKDRIYQRKKACIQELTTGKKNTIRFIQKESNFEVGHLAFKKYRIIRHVFRNSLESTIGSTNGIKTDKLE